MRVLLEDSSHPDRAPVLTTHPAERQKLTYARELKEAAYRFAAERLRRGILDVVFPDDRFLPPHVRTKRGPP